MNCLIDFVSFFIAVIEWSRNQKFELVDMEVQNSSDIMDDDLDDNIYGVDRLVEALHTHLWPNRILKADAANPRVEGEAGVNEVEDQLGNIRLNTGNQDHSNKLLMENVLGSSLILKK